MITLVAIPKPFIGHIGTIQRNALESWRFAFPEAQILLLGAEEGVAEAAIAVDAEHLPALTMSKLGTPLLSDAFARSTTAARHGIVAFVNADVILLGGLREALRHLPGEEFLLIGQCREIDIGERVCFGAPDVHERLEGLWRGGRRRGPFAMDYFVFSPGLFRDVPPFAVGRVRYDNWLVWRALDRGAVVIDATRTVSALHQNHDYRHIDGGMRATRFGEEARANRTLAGWGRCLHLHSILDCTHALHRDGLRSVPGPRLAFLQQLGLRFLLRAAGR